MMEEKIFYIILIALALIFIWKWIEIPSLETKRAEIRCEKICNGKVEEFQFDYRHGYSWCACNRKNQCE